MPLSSLFDRRPAPGRPRVALAILAFIAVVAALWAAQVFLIPVVLAGLVSCGLEPFHRRLVRWHVPRPLSAGLLLAGLVALLAGGAWALQSEATTVLNQLPSLTQKLRQTLREGGNAISSTVQPVQKAADELQKAADTVDSSAAPRKGAAPVQRVQVEEAPMRLSDLVWRGTMGAVALIGEVTIVLFLAYYMLSSGDRYKEKIVAIAGPSVQRRRVAIEVLNRILLQVERFLMARLLLSVFVAVATAAALMVFGVDQAVIWGVFAGLLSNIPYVGPIVATCAITLVAFVQFEDVRGAATAGGTAAVIVLFEGYVLAPWMLGRAGRMNTGAVFVSLMFWGWIWGVWGMLFAVPIMMGIKVICDHVEPLAPISELLGD